MRIAVALHSGFGLHSIKQVSASLMQVLGQEHTLATKDACEVAPQQRGDRDQDQQVDDELRDANERHE